MERLICKSLPFCRLYMGSLDRSCFPGRAELKKSSCVQMFPLEIVGHSWSVGIISTLRPDIKYHPFLLLQWSSHHFARTILHFPFVVALRCSFSPLFLFNLFLECQHIVWKKKGTVWPRAKIEKHFFINFGWNWKRTSDRVKTLQNGSWKIALGAEFRTRWKLYKMALEFFLEYECNCLTIFGWKYHFFCWKKRSNVVDKGAPFCRVEFVPYHFVGWKKPFCSGVCGHTIL